MPVRIADDFGLGRKHDQVILSLMEAGRLDGTSVMVNDAIEPADIARLRALRDAGAQVGLHLNLTQLFPECGPVWPLTTLMLHGRRKTDCRFARPTGGKVHRRSSAARPIITTATSTAIASPE